MARYVISIDICGDEVHIDVSRNGEFYDEVEFHVSEVFRAVSYVVSMVQRILARELLKDAINDAELFPELFKEVTE